MSESNSGKVPGHVAIIMDGNGRWAKSRNLPRTQGHIEGVRRVEELMEYAPRLGIKVLTLFTFSTENWTRPEHEVSMLMETLISVLRNKIRTLTENNIKFHFIGKKEGIPESVLRAITATIEETKNNTGMIVNMAFNYGSRVEMIDAVKEIARDVQGGRLSVDNISEKVFSDHLYTKDLPDPDLLIRTSGEKRISNFLLWQLSYTEFYFTNKFWPEFTAEELQKAMADFQGRERRFGNIHSVK